MTRRSDPPGSYREWAAEQRATDQAERRAEQQRKARERDRLAKEAIARDHEATAKTAAADRQVAALQDLLRASLTRDPRISLVPLRRRAEVPPLELGQLTPKEFEAFIQNLFTKMGFDTKPCQASGDDGIDCVVYDPHPITGGKFIVQAKL